MHRLHRISASSKASEPYGYLIKPFSEHELRATLEIALHKCKSDLQLLKAYEDLSAMARELRLKNEELADQLRLAHQMQLSMLPTHFPSVPMGATPNQSAVSFESLFTPSGPISGDFFSTIQVSETAVGVFICDVMGHNVSAALVTGMIRALVEEYGSSPDAANAGQLLSRINAVLARMFEQTEGVVFATAVYLLADLARGQIRYANAAHPSPLYLSRARSQALPIHHGGLSNPALGLFKDAVYETHQQPMTAGDSILMFTDGIFDIEGPEDQQFSEQRLVQAVQKRVQLPVHQLFGELIEEVEDFAAGRRFHDDICLVAMEINRCG